MIVERRDRSEERDMMLSNNRSEAMKLVWRNRRRDTIIAREEGMRPLSVGLVRSTLATGRIESWKYTMTKPLGRKGAKWHETIGLDR